MAGPWASRLVAGLLAVAAGGCTVPLPADEKFASFQDAGPDVPDTPDSTAETGCQDNSECDDGVACTLDACTAGSCSHTPKPLACDDNNPCTTDGCDKASGCANLPQAVTCTDGDPCSVGDTCAGGKCASGKQIDCNDNNKCTVEFCAKPGGCTYTTAQVERAPCTDGNACTAGEVCNAIGGCVDGKPTVCNDNNVCTDDGCDPAVGCTTTANDAPCTDNNACTDDGCAGGTCKGTKSACNDDNPCTKDDLCDATAGCIHTALASGPCDDGNACTTGDSCNGKDCTTGKTAVVCDDKNLCTTDSCKPASGCVAVNNALPCDDGLACSIADACQAGTCKGTVTTGETLVQSPHQDIGYAVVSTPTGVAVAGTMFVPNKNEEFRLLRLDHAGKVLGDETFGSSVQDSALALARLPDGGFVLAGYHKPSENTDAYLVRVNAAGQDTWHLKFGGAGVDEAHAVVRVPAGGIAFSGFRTNDGADFWLVRLDLDGNQQWEASYDGGVGESAVGLAALADGFILVGSCQPPGAGSIKKMRAVRTDSAGKLLWSKLYGKDQDTTAASSVAAVADGFFIGGNRISGDGNTSDADALVMRTDLDGVVLWEKTMGGAGGDRVLGVVAVADGFVAAGDHAPTALLPVDAGLWRFDPKGQLLFWKSFEGPLFDSFRTIATTPTGLVMAGYRKVSNMTSNDVWVVRTDLSGGVDCTGTGACGKGCNDGKPCTADWCDTAKAGCMTSPLPDGSPCEDGDLCLVGETCKADVCSGGKANGCDDGNACTVDACTKGIGCTHKAVVDGSSCLPGGTCVAGVCKGDAACAKGFDVTVAGVAFSGATRLSDGGFCAVGTALVADVKPGLHLVRLDAAGKVVWNVASQDQGQTSPAAADVAELPGGDLVGVGRVVTTAAGDVQGRAWRVDAKGADVWTQTLGGTGQDGWGAVAVLASGGVAVVGETDAKGKGGLDAWLVVFDAAGKVKIDKTFGGAFADSAHDVLAAADGGLVLAASTASQGAGGQDAWLLRTDAAGNVLWERLWGGTGDDRLEVVVAQPDGGLALLQTTAAPASLTKVLRTDALGVPLWTASPADATGLWLAHNLAPLADGGLAIVGGTAKTGPVPNDLWYLRLSPEGHTTMQRTLDGGSEDVGRALVPLPGGGVVFAGVKSASSGKNGTGWLLRTDDWGNTSCSAAPKCAAKNSAMCDDINTCTVDWCDETGTSACKNLGLASGTACSSGGCSVGDTCSGSKCQPGKAKLWTTKGKAPVANAGLGLTRSTQGGFVVAGYRADGGRLARVDVTGLISADAPVGAAGTHYADVETVSGGVVAAGTVAGDGGSDGHALRRSDADQTVWQFAYGGAKADGFADVAPLAGGFAFVGTTASQGAGGDDMWVVRTDDGGKAIWTKAFGGKGDDQGHAAARIGDGLAVIGWTSAKGAGAKDAWLVRLDADGEIVWDATYGGVVDDQGRDVVALADGFALAGMRGVGKVTQAWLARVDGAGKLLWQIVAGDGLEAFGYGIAAVPGGLALSGMQEHLTGKLNMLLLRTDLVGNVVWTRTYNFTVDERAHAVIALPDGFALAGETEGDLRLVRTDVYGNPSCNEALGCIYITGCDDGKACTLDSCIAPKGCAHALLSDGAACDDGKPCTAAEVCSAGVCAGGAPSGCL